MNKNAFGFAAALLLVACGGPSSESSVETNVVVTDVVDGDKISGRYDPTGFTQANARKMAGFSCVDAQLATYGEAAVDGQNVFEATCTSGIVHGKGSGVNFTRTGVNSAKYSSIFSLNGELVFDSGEFPL